MIKITRFSIFVLINILFKMFKLHLHFKGNLSPLLSHQKNVPNHHLRSENNATKIIHKRCLGKIRFEKHLMLRRLKVQHLSF